MPAYQTQLERWKKFYEWCRPFIKNYKTAIDIGCDTFGFAKWLEPDFDHIHCFDFRDRLSFLEKSVNNKDKFTYHNTGLGETKTTRLTKRGVGKIKEFGDIKVKVTTLDSFDFVDIGFIKLDVEGYETKILQGAVRTIENNNPTIVVEQNKNDFTASNFLKNLGYKHVDTWNSLSTNEPNDFIFTR